MTHQVTEEPIPPEPVQIRVSKRLIKQIIECALRHPEEWRPVWHTLEAAYKEKRQLEKQTRQRQPYPLKTILNAINLFNQHVSDETFRTVAINMDTAQVTRAFERVHQLLKVPDILVGWLRFQDYFAFSRPLRVLALGIQGSGKSSLLEAFAIRYPKIFDLYGSSDNEGLCWCKSEFEWFFTHLYGRPPRILLITGNEKDVASKHDVKKIAEVKGLRDFKDYDVITTVYGFYTSEEKYFASLQKITHILWVQRTYWHEPWFVLVREAADWVYARLKVVKDESAAKKEFVKDYRQARHHGIAIGVDTLRWTNIDKEIRDLADYTFLKALGDAGLPRDLRWLYRYFQPLRLMHLKPHVFGLKTSKGAVGYGRFDYPQWHKEEKENILKLTGIEVKQTSQTLPDDRRYGVGDFTHSKIIIKYIEKKSMHKAAADLGRSSQTIKTHIDRHNMAVERKGECPKCHHAKCEFSKDYIITKKR